jgi:hypothetical protein
MRLDVRRIAQAEQAYPICGDWMFTKAGKLRSRVSRLLLVHKPRATPRLSGAITALSGCGCWSAQGLPSLRWRQAAERLAGLHVTGFVVTGFRHTPCA